MVSPARAQQRLPGAVASGHGDRVGGALATKALQARLDTPHAGRGLELTTAAMGLRSGGTLLDRSTRSMMERRYGRGFDDVRVHTDAMAATAARDLRARAYTVGSHIAFGARQYAPHSV